VQSSVNTLGTYIVVALVVVIGVIGLSLCADALGAECEHLCCSTARHAAMLERIVRKTWAVVALSAAFALPLFALSARRARTSVEFAHSLTPVTLTPLRI
jgi:hypothetical protein